MIQTIIVYSLLAFSMFYFTNKSIFYSGVRSKLYYLLPIFLYTIVFGIRYGVGIDYFSYKEIYENYNEGNWLYVGGAYSFYLICDLGYKLDLSIPCFFSIFSFLQISFIYLTFKNRKIILSYSILALLLTGIGISGFNNIIKQSVSFCIFVYALSFIENKRLLCYCLCILIAFSFHLSAIILLPIYFFFNRGQNYFQNIKVQFFLIICCYCISWLNIGNIIAPHIEYLSMFLDYDGYFNTHFVEAKGRSNFDVLLFIINLFLINLYPKLKSFYKDRLFEIIYTLYFISVCLGYLLIDIHILWRILAYFTYLKFILFGYYLLYFKKTIKFSYKNFLCAMFFISYILGFYVYSILYKSYNSRITYSTYYQTNLYQKQEKMNFDYMNR